MMINRFICFISSLHSCSFVKSQIVGPKPCPLADTQDPNKSVMGYDNTTILTDDMVMIMDNILNQVSVYEDEYVFTLCPNTVFDMGTNLGGGEHQHMAPIITLLHNTTIRCGEDGKWTNNCTLRGGWNHVHLEDDFVFSNATFLGITFEANEGVSVTAHGGSFIKGQTVYLSSAFFFNCLWNKNSNKAVVDIYWHPDLENGVEFRNGGNRHRFLRKMKNQMFPRENEEGTEVKFEKKNNTTNSALFQNNYAISSELRSKLEGLRAHENWNEHRRLVVDSQGSDDSMIMAPSTRKLQHNAMFVSFAGCIFFNNKPDYFVIANDGGHLDIARSLFQYNFASSIIGTVDHGALYLRNGTKFSNNLDLIGPVYIDRTSRLGYHDETVTGENNTIGLNFCEDIFFDSKGGEESCYKRPRTCSGVCCEFENEECDDITFPPTSAGGDESRMTPSSSPVVASAPPSVRNEGANGLGTSPSAVNEDQSSSRLPATGNSLTQETSSSSVRCGSDCKLALLIGLPVLFLSLFAAIATFCMITFCLKKEKTNSNFEPPIQEVPGIQ